MFSIDEEAQNAEVPDDHAQDQKGDIVDEVVEDAVEGLLALKDAAVSKMLSGWNHIRYSLFTKTEQKPKNIFESGDRLPHYDV